MRRSLDALPHAFALPAFVKVSIRSVLIVTIDAPHGGRSIPKQRSLVIRPFGRAKHRDSRRPRLFLAIKHAESAGAFS